MMVHHMLVYQCTNNVNVRSSTHRLAIIFSKILKELGFENCGLKIKTFERR